jgi:hypothetical protein
MEDRASATCCRKRTRRVLTEAARPPRRAAGRVPNQSLCSSYTYPALSSGGAAAIATCTALENACCLHAFEDAKITKGQGEWWLMVQIGCRCCPPQHKQDLFLELVRGFGAREAPAEWRQQLVALKAEEGLAEKEGEAEEPERGPDEEYVQPAAGAETEAIPAAEEPPPPPSALCTRLRDSSAGGTPSARTHSGNRTREAQGPLGPGESGTATGQRRDHLACSRER